MFTMIYLSTFVKLLLLQEIGFNDPEINQCRDLPPRAAPNFHPVVNCRFSFDSTMKQMSGPRA